MFPDEIQRNDLYLSLIHIFHAVVQTLQPVLTVGGIAVHQPEPRVFQREHTALVVVLRNADAGGHGQRLLTAPAGRAGVALLLGRICLLYTSQTALQQVHDVGRLAGHIAHLVAGHHVLVEPCAGAGGTVQLSLIHI